MPGVMQVASSVQDSTCCGAAYCGTSTVWAVLGFLGEKLGSGSPQDGALKPPPSLAPVATPRAPSPHKAPAAAEKEAVLRSSPGHPNALPAINPTSPRFAAVPPVVTGLACGSVSTSQVQHAHQSERTHMKHPLHANSVSPEDLLTPLPARYQLMCIKCHFRPSRQ